MLTMAVGSLPQITFARDTFAFEPFPNEITHGVIYDQHLDVLHDLHQDIIQDIEVPNEPPQPEAVEHSTAISGLDMQSANLGIQRFNTNQPISQRRLMYQQLLDGNYFAGELIARFEEMFGVHSATYIRENFTILFDIAEDEIDEGILNIIAPMRQVRMEQHEASLNVNARLRGFGDDLSDINFWDIEEDLIPSDEYGKDGIYSDESIELSEFPALEVVMTTPSALNPMIQYSADYATDLTFQPFGITPFSTSQVRNQDVNVRLISSNTTSMTVEVFYDPAHSHRDNRLRIYDFTSINPGFNGAWRELARRTPAGRRQFVITGLMPGALYRVQASIWDSSAGVWVDSMITVRLPGARTPSLTVTHIGNNSITVSAVFPFDRAWGNRVRFFNGVEWVSVGGADNLSSGSVTINNLAPGMRYQVALQHVDWNVVAASSSNSTSTATRIQHSVRTTMPPESLVSFQASSVHFQLDRTKVDAMGSARASNFVAATNRAYYVIHDFVGGARPFNGAPMQLRSTRTLPWHTEGRSGNPMLWNTHTVTDQSVFFAVDQARAMTRLNANTTETPIHEIGHNFEHPRWSFESEALAVFFTYHYYAMTNERLALASQSQVWVGGAGFRTYMRSHANRVLGSINRDAAMAQGVYSPYSLAYRLADIAGRIGWQPYRQTFRAFLDLPANQVPSTNIGKFNLFLTMLSDFSGQNVFNMLTAQERQIFGAYLGGTIQRVTLAEDPNVAGGVVFSGGVIRPIRAANEATIQLNINELGINTGSRWLTYNFTIRRPSGSSVSIWGSKNLFNNPSVIRQDVGVLGTQVGTTANWEISMTLEQSANAAFLLPTNANLAGRAVVKLTMVNRNNGDVYYFEFPLPDQGLMTQYRNIAWNTNVNSRDEINNAANWHLNHRTVDGAANNVNLTSAQAGFDYNMVRVRERIGRAAFDQAFAYMFNLSGANQTISQLERTNLFLTKLRDFSGQDVIGMFSSQALSHFGQVFGGTIAYRDGVFLPSGLRWNSYFDRDLNAMMYTTASRVPAIGQFRNVYVAVLFEGNNPLGNVFVIGGGNDWHRIGHITLGTAGLPRGVAPVPTSGLPMVSYLPSTSLGLTNPTVMSNPNQNQTLNSFDRFVRFWRNVDSFMGGFNAYFPNFFVETGRDIWDMVSNAGDTVLDAIDAFDAATEFIYELIMGDLTREELAIIFSGIGEATFEHSFWLGQRGHWFQRDNFINLTRSEAWELGWRTAGTVMEAGGVALIAYTGFRSLGAAFRAASQKIRAFNVVKTLRTKLHFNASSLQHTFSRHASDFGITGNWNNANRDLFEQTLRNHVNSVHNPVRGTYRGTTPMYHFFDERTGLNVMIDPNGNFAGGWRLSYDQIRNLRISGNIQ